MAALFSFSAMEHVCLPIRHVSCQYATVCVRAATPEILNNEEICTWFNSYHTVFLNYDDQCWFDRKSNETYKLLLL